MTSKMVKTSHQLERHFKGAANHWRIDMLLLIAKRDGVTQEEIIEILKGNQKTFSAHTTKLVQAGLVNKKYIGRNVLYTLSPYGKHLTRFIKEFSVL